MADDRAPRRVGVVGAGGIGIGWAVVFARGGCQVLVTDPDAARLAAATHQVSNRLARLHAAGLLDEEVDTVLARVSTAPGIVEAVADAEYVQECGPENLAIKQGILGEIDAGTGRNVVVGSSSSAITCSQMAADLAGRDRFLVVHPGNPPYLLPVAELVPAPFTDPSVVRRASAFLEAMGMSPVIVTSEIEGFVFNRLQGAVLREAYCLVRDGVISAPDLDRIVKDGLGRRWSVVGPFATADLNIPGGLEAHAARMAASYARMGSERGQDDPWTDDLVREVADQIHADLPLRDWEANVRRRDDALMHMERARRTCPEVGGGQTDSSTTASP